MEINEIRQNYINQVMDISTSQINWLPPCEQGRLTIQAKQNTPEGQVNYTITEQYIKGKLNRVSITNNKEKQQKTEIELADQGTIQSIQKQLKTTSKEIVHEIHYGENEQKTAEVIRKRGKQGNGDLVLNYDEQGRKRHYLLERSDIGEKNIYYEYEKDEKGQCLYFLKIGQILDKIQVETRFYDKDSREELSEEEFTQKYPEYDLSRYHLLWDDVIEASQLTEDDYLVSLIEKYQNSEEELEEARQLLSEYRRKREMASIEDRDNQQEEQRG